MHSSRNIVRQPSVYRVIRAPAATRQMSIFGPSPSFPRFAQPSVPSFNHGFNDLFRMMDDFAATARTFDHFTAPARLRAIAPTFQPRFDIHEQNDIYELRGELPGVKTENLEVEFTDAQTLVIRGKTEQESTRGNVPSAPQPAPVEAASQPAAVEAAVESAPAEAVNTVAADNSDAASVRSNTSYQKPTVEDEDAAAEVQSIASSAPDQATPVESVAEEQAPTTETQTVQATTTEQPQPSTQQQQPESRYWVSERSVGSFQRVFQFPTRVDHDNIKASLKDGLLSITIPKAQAPGVRRINVL